MHYIVETKLIPFLTKIVLQMQNLHLCTSLSVCLSVQRAESIAQTVAVPPLYEQV